MNTFGAETDTDYRQPAGPQLDSDIVCIGNIGEGDNADWIKHVDAGRHQRADLAAHHTTMADYYAAQGDNERADHERGLAAILLSAELDAESQPPETDWLDENGDPVPADVLLSDDDNWGNEEEGFDADEDDW